MKDMNEEEMQQFIDNQLRTQSEGMPTNADKDLKMYSALFEALGKEPPIPMTHNFAGKVTAAIQTQKDRVSYFKIYAILAVGFIVILAAVFLYLRSVNETTSQFMQILAKYRWALIFGSAALLVIQVLDNKLVVKKTA